jgi:hypothetical protein
MVHSGYGRTIVCQAYFFAHAIICEAKMGSRIPKGMVTRHLCSNKLCVEASHLTWGTRRENALDAIAHGELVCKLNAPAAAEIRRQLEQNHSREVVAALAEKYGVSVKTVKGLQHNRQWLHEEPAAESP